MCMCVTPRLSAERRGVTTRYSLIHRLLYLQSRLQYAKMDVFFIFLYMIHGMDDVTDRTLAAEKLRQASVFEAQIWRMVALQIQKQLLILSLQIFHTAT